MMKRLLPLILVFVALVGAVGLVKLNQDTRKSAAGADPALYFGQPNYSGSQISVEVFARSSRYAMSGFEFQLVYPQNSLTYVSSKVNATTFASGSAVFTPSQGVIKFGGVITKPAADLPMGDVSLGTITFNNTGSGTIAFSSGLFSVYDPANLITSVTPEFVPSTFDNTEIKPQSGTVNFTWNRPQYSIGTNSSELLQINAGANKLSAFSVVISYPKDLITVNSVVVNSLFDSVPVMKISDLDGTITISALSNKPEAQLFTGGATLVTINSVGKSIGSGSFKLVSFEGAGRVNGVSGPISLGTTELGPVMVANAGTVSSMPTATVTTKPVGYCSNDTDCGFCGTNCGIYNPAMMCPMIAVPADLYCRCVSNSCKTVSAGGVTSGVTPVPASGAVMSWVLPNLTPGATGTAKLMINVGSGKVSGVSGNIRFTQSLISIGNVMVNPLFNTVVSNTVDNNNGLVRLDLLSSRPEAELPTGSFELLSMPVTASLSGQGTLSYLGDVAGRYAGVATSFNLSGNSISFNVGNGGGVSATPTRIPSSVPTNLPTNVPTSRPTTYTTPTGNQINLSWTVPSLKAGETGNIELWANSGNAAVSAMSMEMSYPTFITVLGNPVVNSKFNTVVTNSVNSTIKIITVQALASVASSQLPSGSFQLVSIPVRADAAGTGNFTLASNEFAGNNNGTPVSFVVSGMSTTMTVAGGGSATATPLPQATATPVASATPVPGTTTLNVNWNLPSINAGESASASLVVNAGANKLSGAVMSIRYPATISVGDITVNPSFNSVFAKTVDPVSRIITLQALASVASDQLPTGTFDLVTFPITGVSAGQGEFRIISYELGGSVNGNPASFSIDNVSSVFTVGDGVQPTATAVPTAVVNPTGLPQSTPTPIPGAPTTSISFVLSLSNVKDTATCLADPKVNVTVLGNGGKQINYEGVSLTKIGATVDGIATYKGDMVISGLFGRGEKISLLIGGIKHTISKFGMDNQGAYYNRQDGDLALADGATYNLTGYPLLGGDVTGPDGVPDGIIDGRDYAYVKEQILSGPDGNSLADLDFNCSLGAQDMNILKISLYERQSQLY